MNLHERFWSKVSFPRGGSDGCWLWSGAAGGGGYGHLGMHGRTVKAHRVSWALHRGEIADSMYLDHLCRNRLCVRPDHLEVVTPSVNTSRGHNSLRPQRKACKKGHPIAGDNKLTTVVSGHPWTTCRICFMESARERNRKHRARARRELLCFVDLNEAPF